MLSTPTVAFLAIDAVAADGKAFVLEVEVGTPVEREKELWACPMALRGLLPRCQDIFGSDSLLALCLTLSYVGDMLQHFVATGGRLTIDGEDLCIQAYFAPRFASRAASPPPLLRPRNKTGAVR